MRHVAPHRWADAWAGKLPADEAAALDAHAAECPRCASARGRVQRISSTTFPALRAQSAPDLGWDSVRAKVHWSVSTAKHARLRPAPRWPLVLASAGALAGAAVLGLATGAPTTREPAQVASVAPRAIEARPAPVGALVSRVAGPLMIDGLREADPFARTLAAGAVIATADGRVDLQFGEGSALSLGARSTLELRRFDAGSIELALDGSVDIVVAPRAAGQLFVVHAGAADIEVRGTQFRVARDAKGVRVQCRHGVVDVRDASGSLAVVGERGAFVPAGATVAAQHAEPLTDAELAQLAQATPVMLPWSARESSLPLAIDASGGSRAIRIDGVEVGAAPLRVRALPGRHTVEAADRAGRYRRIGWVDVGAGQPSQLAVPPLEEPAPQSTAAQRKHELDAGLDRVRPRLRACTRSIAKEGLATYVQIEIAVDASGAVGMLNIVETELGAGDQACVLDALRRIAFATGPAATWHQKIDL